jgi:hypothetical protein
LTDWYLVASEFPGYEPGDLLDPELPVYPGWCANVEPPPDPFADWYESTAAHHHPEAAV